MALGLIVDAGRGPGRRGRDHGLVGRLHLGALDRAPVFLDRLEHLCGRQADLGEVRVALVELGHQRQDADGCRDVLGGDGGVGEHGCGGFGHPISLPGPG